MKKNDDKARFIIVGLLLLVMGIMIGISLNTAETNKLGDDSEEASAFSVDDSDSVMKTLSYEETKAMLDDRDRRQMVYVGCRYCSFCQQFEPIIDDFLESKSEPMSNRERIVKWEGGYRCYVDSEHEDYDLYTELERRLLTGPTGELTGTPRFLYIEGGEIKDELSSSARTVDGLQAFFDKNNYTK